MGFFNELSKKASETYKNTAEKTNKLTKEMKLKSLINEDKGKIGKIYCEIGKKVYEKHIREENIDIASELKEECSKIDAYSKEIEDMNNEIRALKDLRLCKVCASEISISARFCPKCGAVQDEIKNVDSATSNSDNTELQIIEAPATEILVKDEGVIEINNNTDNQIDNNTDEQIDNNIDNQIDNNNDDQMDNN